jgi:glycosyltransferase involved in cell wall biosynthesis
MPGDPKPMRIAVWHNLPSGGGKRAMFDHVRGLVERGHHVEAWCPSSADQTFLPLAEVCQEHVLPWDDRPPRARWVGAALRSAATIYRRLDAIDRHCRAVGEAVNVGGFDVLFANACQFFRTTPIGRYVRVPSLIYLQEPYRWLYEAMPTPPFMSPQPPGRSRLAPWYLRHRAKDFFDNYAQRVQVRAEYENAKAFNRILVNSYFSRESVLRAYGLDSTVCYLGIDVQHFTSSGVSKSDYVLGLGALVPEKNAEFIIRAVGCVRSGRPRLIWVGNVQIASHVRQLKVLAGQCGVQLDTRTRVSDGEVVDLLSGARALLYAPRLEPFGYAPLEANACGTPVIAVAEGGVRETIRDGVNGLVVDARPELMGRAIERLLQDPELSLRLSEQGMQVVRENWTLDSALDRLEQNLNDIANSDRRTIR